MAGIFRFNTNQVSPNRRTAMSPFCPSPSHFQDATADSTTASLDCRPPSLFGGSANGSGGNTSPNHRTSLRDQDEQLQALKKDNFNLKLRIYFLEDTASKMPNEGKEALCKQIVDLKVETEALRSELKEKQNLICEAATALELMDQNQQTVKAEKEAALEELMQENQKLQEQLASLENTSLNSVRTNDLSANHQAVKRISELEIELKITQEENTALAKRLEETEKSHRDLELSKSDLVDANEKGRKMIRTLREKQSRLEEELEVFKGQQSKLTSAVGPTDLSCLQEELAAAKQDAENAHKWRNDCLEVCGALTIRLRELAEFLDSLLSNKDVLNAIAQDRRKMMRSSVDKSLDISKSFRRMSMSMIGATNFTLNESNLLNQLTSLTDVLHNSMAVVDHSMVVDDKENRPTNKTERRTSRLDMSHESDLGWRLAQLKTQSESEDWSEPDRQVSHERIGLDGAAMYRNSPNKHNHETNTSSASNSEAASDKARRNTSAVRLQSRIGDLEKQLTERNDKNAQLTKHLSEKVQTIQELEEKIEKYSQQVNTSSSHDNVNSIRAALEQKEDDLLRMQQERDSASVDLRLATMKLASLQQEMTELKKRHSQDVDDIMQEQRTNIEKAKQNMTERHQIDIEQNYVLRNDYDALGNTVVEQQQEIATLQRLVQDLRENEDELKAEIMESERNVRALKKSVDDATLLSSAGVLERNRLKSEKEELQTILNALQIERNADLVTINELRSQLNSYLPLQSIPLSSNSLGRSASSGNVRYAIRTQLSATHCGFRSSSSTDEKALRLENFSPDLGIESDTGCRTSGSDTERQNRSAPAYMGNVVVGSFVEEDENSKFVADNHAPAGPHNCVDVDRELYELRRDNQRKSEQLKQILNKLRISNGRKEQAERDIRRELLKTHVVLKNARVNIEKAANVNE